MTELRDGAVRETAVTDFDANLVVIAGAGTGKTSLLVERALNQYLSGRTRLMEMVAITFTRKAAGELKVRFADALGAILAATDPGRPVPPPAGSEAERSLVWLRSVPGTSDLVLHERARAALEELDGAAISTIHAFASDILRRHPVEAGLPPDYAPDEGEAMKLLFEELWPLFLTEELGEKGENGTLWMRVLGEFGQEDVEKVARALSQSPAALDLLEREGYEALDPLVVFRDRIESARPLLEMWTPKVDKQLRQMMETHIELLGVLETEGLIAFQSFPDHRVRPATFWRRRLAYATPRKMPEEDAVPLEDAVTDIHLLLLLLRRLESRDLGSLMAVLRLFARRFRRECSRVGAPSLDDLLLRARNLLRDHPAIRDEEARRSRVLLVDEFQDTDPLQYEIVFLLAAAASPEPDLDPWLSALEDGRLFIVGDPKQSIYRFRGADMAAFERAVRHVEAARGRRLTLEVNFRSRPRILDAVNRLFGAWVESTDPEIDPEYTAIHPHRPETGESPRVEVWSLEAPLEDRADALRDHEARLLARSILEWRDSGRFAYRDMAVLFRSLTKLAIYTTALRDAGIEYVVDGGKHFSERPEIVEAVALLRALANPADPVGALGVLRSAVGGATDAELAAFSRAGGVFSWRPNAANDEVLETFPAVQRTFQTLRDLETRTRRLPADRRILSLLTEGDFPVLMASYFEGAQRVANVRKLAHRAAELARDRKLSMDETVQALEQELLGEYNEGESPLADEAIDAVRILSIHAAKGLEFPLVVLPDLPRRGEHPEMDPAVKVALRDGAPRVAVRTGYKADMAMVEAGKVDTEHEKAEFKRLLYVATTRAKERLIVINSNRTQIGSWVKAMEEPWSYHVSEKTFPRREVLVEGMVAHRLIPADAAPVTAVRREAPDLVEPIRAFEAAAAAAAVEREPRHRTPSGDAHAAALDRNLDPGAPSAPPPELARIVGTAVHWALERWNFRDPGVLVAHLETAVGDRVQGGVPSDRILAEGRRVLEGFLASGLPAYLGGVEILARELPILFRDGAGRTVHGYIDLVYTAGGTVHVADYKTDAGSGEAAVEQYRNQVADYAEAVRRGWNLDGPPVCELLMLRTGGRIEVPPV